MPPPPPPGFASRLLVGPALRSQSDKRLVKLVREGYEAAFEEIVHRYGKPLGRYAGAIVGSRSEDVTQDAFSKALLAMRRDDAEIELRPWLYRIVRNTALNDLRDSPPAPEALAEAIASGRSAAEEAEQREELRELIERLRALPEPQRAAIVMRELEGLSHDEIAAALGLSGGAARQAIYRARQALRDGIGMLVPLPILRLLFEHGDAAAASVGAGAGGALAAGGVAGGAGAGGALKAGAVAAVLAGSVGTGIALQDDGGRSGKADAATAVPTAPLVQVPVQPPPSGSAATDSGPSSDSNDDREDDGRGKGRGRGRDGDDDDRRDDRDRDEKRDDDRDDDRSGRSHGDEEDDDRSGPSGSGSSRRGHSDSDDDSDERIPDSPGPGSSGGGHSGSGSDDDGHSDDDFEPDDDPSSGSSGSGSSGSPSGSSSGSNSDDALESEEPDDD